MVNLKHRGKFAIILNKNIFLKNFIYINLIKEKKRNKNIDNLYN